MKKWQNILLIIGGLALMVSGIIRIVGALH